MSYGRINIAPAVVLATGKNGIRSPYTTGIKSRDTGVGADPAAPNTSLACGCHEIAGLLRPESGNDDYVTRRRKEGCGCGRLIMCVVLGRSTIYQGSDLRPFPMLNATRSRPIKRSSVDAVELQADGNTTGTGAPTPPPAELARDSLTLSKVLRLLANEFSIS